MTVSIKGKKLVIETDIETPTPSASGKSLVIASTRGSNKTAATFEGRPVAVNLNVYIPLKGGAAVPTA